MSAIHSNSARASKSVSRARATRKISRQMPRKAPRAPVMGHYTAPDKMPTDLWMEVIRLP